MTVEALCFYRVIFKSDSSLEAFTIKYDLIPSQWLQNDRSGRLVGTYHEVSRQAKIITVCWALKIAQLHPGNDSAACIATSYNTTNYLFFIYNQINFHGFCKQTTKYIMYDQQVKSDALSPAPVRDARETRPPDPASFTTSHFHVNKLAKPLIDQS